MHIAEINVEEHFDQLFEDECVLHMDTIFVGFFHFFRVEFAYRCLNVVAEIGQTWQQSIQKLVALKLA